MSAEKHTSQLDLKSFPEAVSAIHETQKFFHEAQELPHDNIELDVGERTADGFIELGWEHLELQRSLHLDFQHEMRNLDRAALEGMAAPHIAAINKDRNEPIDGSKINEHFLRRLVEPRWLDASKGDLSNLPGYIGEKVEYLHEVDAKLAILSQDEQLRGAAEHEYNERLVITRAAVNWQKADEKKDGLARQISDTYQRVGESGRGLDKVDQRRIARLEQEIESLQPGDLIVDERQIPLIEQEIRRLMRKDWHRQLERGLLLTDDMKEVIRKVLPSLVRGYPALFVGETGGAKTALAEFIAREYFGKEPEFVSMSAEANVYQLLGKEVLRRGANQTPIDQVRSEVTASGINWDSLSEDKKADLAIVRIGTESVFMPGPIVRAMENGTPVILDEINAADGTLLKRLNKILQLRPGSTFTVQEDSGRQVTVRQGFCIIATANEKSSRYKNIDVMSAEFKNRFNTDVHRIRYPDSTIISGHQPPDNMMLALAVLSNNIGELSVDLPKGQLKAFVKACHKSQKLFSGNYDTPPEGDKVADDIRTYVDQNRLADGKPGLDDTVLAPRTMAAILEKLSAGMGRVELSEILIDWLDGIEKPNDRAVMRLLLDTHVDTAGKTLLGRVVVSEDT